MTDETAEIRDLFAVVAPEVANGVVEFRAIAREKGVMTKAIIFSRDPQIDCMGACVGVRGTRIRWIVEQTNGEQIQLVRWNESIEKLITDALQPAEIMFVRPDHLQRHAKVFVREEHVSLALGRDGRNQRLASQLCGFEIEIVPLSEKDEMQ